MQEELWRNRLHVLRNPYDNSGAFLISGLPSLHIAVVLLGTYYLNKLSKLIGLVSFMFLILTFISTIYFGWHYVVDDIGAGFLVALAILIARKQVKKSTSI